MEKSVMDKLENKTITGMDALCSNSIELIHYARALTVRNINFVEIMTNYVLGKWIVEEQQNGSDRAKYGNRVLEYLSIALTKEFGRGFSTDTLNNARKFFLLYRDRISESMIRKFAVEKTQSVIGKFVNEKSESLISFFRDERPFNLSWTHYLVLIRIKDEKERSFYETEAARNGWNVRTLQRQYASSLYERLLLSSDKEKVTQLAKEGQVVSKPEDIVKDPYILEFLGIPEKAEYSETELETRIINHLQEFIMELGKGFTFVARQKRFTFDEDSFRVDLVMYNRLLRCFVLFDLKTNKLKHQDLGQMQMYVNYYDRFEKSEDENPTIGILLCSDKSDAMVELTLPQDSNIYASKYELYLPDKKLLQKKLEQWLEEEA